MAEVDGTTLTDDDTGGDGPVVVLSHGFLLGRPMGDDGVAVLRCIYRIITWDERRIGDTDDDEQPGLTALRVAPLAPDRVRGIVRLETSGTFRNSD